MNNTFFAQLFQRPFYQYLLILFFVGAGFVAGFFFPLHLSLPLRYNYFFPLVCTFVLLWAAWRLPHPWGEAFSAGITMVLFSASLAAIWRTGIHEIYEVFGLLPWFDSQGYYSEALRLLDGGIFSQISARRPLFPGFFSFILMLTKSNLRISLALISFITGISTWILASEIRLSEKKAVIPAAITTLLFFFYRKFNGAILTETLGFSCGLLGLTLLWNAATNRKLIPALVGLFFMTLALNVRPGAVFSLPLLILWIIFCLKTVSGRLIKIISSSAILIIGLAINILLTSILAPASSSSFSNFANLVYGLVNGGIGWNAVYIDHPEFFTSGNEGLASQKIYQVSWQIFKNHPEKAIQGGIRAIQAFFSTASYSAFNFLGGEDNPREPDMKTAPVVFLSRWAANILLILLLPISMIARRNPKFSLLLAINLGILFSLPFAAPWDVENMRAYTSSIGGMVSAIFLVLLFLFDKGKESPLGSTPRPLAAYGLATVLFLAMTAGPFLIRLTARTPVLPSAQCPTGEVPLITRVSNGSTISIGNNPTDPYSIPYSRFIDNLDQFPDAKIGQQLKKIPENTFISQQNDPLQGDNAVWLAAPMTIMPGSGQLTVFCGNWNTDPETKFIFFAQRALP